MTSESERCVDELLVKLTKIDQLAMRFDSNRNDELVANSRSIITETQTFIDNNRTVIPSYTLKKITDSLRRLESRVDEPDKTKLKFKFKTNTTVKHAAIDTSLANCKPAIDALSRLQSLNLCGFKDKQNETLSLKPDDVNSRDVQLINIVDCTVVIHGLANTVYIRDLKNTEVTVLLACRAVTITGCSQCRFKLVCQQLRIDSTLNSTFETFTSTKSMLESSKDLEFKQFDLEKQDVVPEDQVSELMLQAMFDENRNNWKSIDDFDWLSPDCPSKNFKIVE